MGKSILAQLVNLADGSTILLDKPIVLFGRHPECDIQIDSRKISRRHCCIALVSDYLVVRDLGSTNGVRINGTRVAEGRLRSGDELTIGNSRYQLRIGLPGAVDSAAAIQPRPQSARPIPDDLLLESCDEPIPLEGPPARQRQPDAHPIASPFLLPDNLELAPASDVVPPPPSV